MEEEKISAKYAKLLTEYSKVRNYFVCASLLKKSLLKKIPIGPSASESPQECCSRREEQSVGSAGVAKN